jgi:hypothetical protein
LVVAFGARASYRFIEFFTANIRNPHTRRLTGEPKALLFRTYSRATGQLTGNPLPQANAYAYAKDRPGRSLIGHVLLPPA